LKEYYSLVKSGFLERTLVCDQPKVAMIQKNTQQF